MNVYTLQRYNWSDTVYTALSDLISIHGNTSPTYNEYLRPYAVFDCDNTTVINDIQETLLIFQLENLIFKIDPTEFEDILSTGIHSTDNTKLSALISDCSHDYTYLHSNYIGFNSGGVKSLEQIQLTDAYLDFIVKLRFLYSHIYDTFGASSCYRWITYLFTGMTPQEVQSLAKKSFDYWLSTDKFEVATRTSPLSHPGDAGVVTISYKSGLALVQEMQDLYKTLMANGIDVYVCSASFRDVVLALICDDKYGYCCEPDKVYGMRLETDIHGIFINKFDENFPETHGNGKVDTINTYIRPRQGNADPILVAGDSIGDLEMLTSFPNLKLGLIINCVCQNHFSALCRQAVSAENNENSRYVLQGRDENIGMFRPSQKSILISKISEQLFFDE